MTARETARRQASPPTGREFGLPGGRMDAWRRLRGPGRFWAGLVVVALLAGAALLVNALGGPPTPWVHILYVPIVLAAIVFTLPGGILAGLAAGLIVGAWIPGSNQSVGDWFVQAGLFVFIGGFVGLTQQLLERRLGQNEHLVKKVATIHARTLSTFASTVELRDEPTGGHSSRVAHNARVLGLALDLEPEDLRAVYWAGLLHDLGKIGTPEQILQKPSRLTEEETRTMRRHSDLGADLLLSVSQELRPIAEGIRAHHERWDGSGYPKGLAGEHIPRVGRIVSVVDVFEALTCKRPYRDPQPVQDVLAFLRDKSGWWFDPTLVRLLEDLYWQGKIYTVDAVQALPAVEEPAAVLPVGEAEESILGNLSDYQLGSSGRP
ncbi:MAG TPA: HD-GYP domain-containing protein [Actinomycetota bacterium]|nr:HD-GYP domain-containing protein [Actinomycetota bacterium]